MKRKILIASFLKPVNDIRSYEKIAQTLATNSSYTLYCTGYPSNIELSNNKVKLLPLSYFNKRGFGRIKARWEAYKLYVKVKPELIIVNSPDLLLITCIYKILFGSKIIYDIRENYFRNLWYQKNYFFGLRHLFALLTRSKEVFLSPLFSHFILAEKVYAAQLNFIGNRYMVIENKSLVPVKKRKKKKNSSSFQFLISGTIATEYGVLEGINFFTKIAKTTPTIRLKIIGYCANKQLFQKLIEIEKSNPKITLKIATHPIPHIEIEQAIFASDYGLLPYQENQSIQGKWPTKIYEYMACQLPIIIQENETWNQFIQDHNVGVAINFANLNLPNVPIFLEREFYTNPLPNNIYWSSEEPTLLSVVENCLKE